MISCATTCKEEEKRKKNPHYLVKQQQINYCTFFYTRYYWACELATFVLSLSTTHPSCDHQGRQKHTCTPSPFFQFLSSIPLCNAARFVDVPFPWGYLKRRMKVPTFQSNNRMLDSIYVNNLIFDSIEQRHIFQRQRKRRKRKSRRWDEMKTVH